MMYRYQQADKYEVRLVTVLLFSHDGGSDDT